MTSNPMTVAEIVQICQNAEAMENATVQSIRGLFLTIEAVTLGVAAVLISVKAVGSAIVVVTFFGFIITVFWPQQVRQRTRIVDDWNVRIYNHTRGTQISQYFDTYNQTRLHIRSIRLWLDYFTPSSVFILWVVVLLLGYHA
jgi:hypothetical protein